MTVIQRLNAEGMTILLVEQNAQVVLEIAKNGYVLETDSTSLQGPALTIPEFSRSLLANSQEKWSGRIVRIPARPCLQEI